MTTAKEHLPEQLLSLVAGRFRLLGDNTRLKLVLAVRDTELTVSQIAEAAGTSQANASKHLTALHEAGMIARRREGGSVHYRANGRVPYLLIDAVCTSIDTQARERDALLASVQPRNNRSAA
jgi:DNA-binding transcriptional ArsR family regulator